MRKLLLIAAVAAVLAVPVGVSAAAPSAKPTTTTAATTTTTAPPSGVTGWEKVYSETATQLQPGQIGSVDATCPPGKVVTGGGFELSSTPYFENMPVQYSLPVNNQTVSYGWRVQVKNGNDVPVGIAAWAVCVNGS